MDLTQDEDRTFPNVPECSADLPEDFMSKDYLKRNILSAPKGSLAEHLGIYLYVQTHFSEKDKKTFNDKLSEILTRG